ncbi:MAG: nitroreductase family protein [Clostridia bacterium]|nr:nitroreductase family protein [Clostridia bacterium]
MIKDLMIKERSYRSFDESIKIDRETLVGFVENARLIPSSVNLQPLKYRICNTKDECDTMLSLTKWAALLKDYEIPPKGHAPTAYVVICTDKNVSDKSIFDKDVGIAAQTVMLSAVEAGFGGCMIGNFNPSKVAEALKLPEGVVPSLVLGLGKPDEKIIVEPIGENGSSYYRDADGNHRVPKRSLDEIIL